MVRPMGTVDADGTIQIDVEPCHSIFLSWHDQIDGWVCAHSIAAPEGWTSEDVWSWVEQGLPVPADPAGGWFVYEGERNTDCGYCSSFGSVPRG